MRPPSSASTISRQTILYNGTGQTLVDVNCTPFCGTGAGADGLTGVAGSGDLLGGENLENGAFARSDFDFQKNSVPEPATLALVGQRPRRQPLQSPYTQVASWGSARPPLCSNSAAATGGYRNGFGAGLERDRCLTELARSLRNSRFPRPGQSGDPARFRIRWWRGRCSAEAERSDRSSASGGAAQARQACYRRRD